MISWVPKYRELPLHLLDAPTAWDEVESVIAPLCQDFKVARHSCLEFGVQHAYSTCALSNYFDVVVGIDTFLGDPCAGEHPDNFLQTVDSVKKFPNIRLYQSDWREWCHNQDRVLPGKQWDFIHVDIFHVYNETFDCGQWALAHSPCVVFHDTLSFPEVGRAVANLSRMSGRTFYNLNEKHGLGILSEVNP
jgi:hypothetical protein